MVKRALVIGVNRYRSVTPLRGCVSDAYEIGIALRVRGFSVRMLADERADLPAILERLEWLAETPADGAAVLHYSAHGTQFRDPDGDEIDSRDEVVCPFDSDPRSYWDRGMLSDDVLAKKLPQCPTVVIADTCHSGTQSRDIYAGNPHDIRNRSIAPPIDVSFRAAEGTESGRNVMARMRATPLYYFGASQDDQTAADFFEPDCVSCKRKPEKLVAHGVTLGYHGALSRSWLLAEDGQREYGAYQENIARWFHDRPHFSQRPSFELLGGARLEDPLPGF